MGTVSILDSFTTSPWSWSGILAAAVAARIIAVVLYRRYLHPLAKIPGPFLPAVTYFYQFYYNMSGGRFYKQIENLHKKYGPVVRINPDEIHLSDPENYDKIYSHSSKFYKAPYFYAALGSFSATFATVSNEEHRVRRAALNPFFSRKMVLELEDVVQSKVAKLEQRIYKAFSDGKSVDLHYGFRAISIDVITDYAFDNCYNFLEHDDFGVPFFTVMQSLGAAFWFFQQFPFVRPLALGIPLWLNKLMSKPLGDFLQTEEDCRKQIIGVKATIDAAESKRPARMTIFHQLLTPNITEGHVAPTVEELKDEALIIVSAAADTTGNAMTIAAFNVVSNQDIYKKLTAELKEAFPDPSTRLDFLTLEKLPYLTGVIKEALRLSFGVIGRLPRATPEPGAVFNGYSVPAGAIIGMSSWMMHRNEDVFPNAENFDPSRWLDPVAARVLERHMVPFGKGSRQCVGMQLAYCELYVTLGTIFRRFENMKVEKTSAKDLVYEDYFSAYHPQDANRLYVVAG